MSISSPTISVSPPIRASCSAGAAPIPASTPRIDYAWGGYIGITYNRLPDAGRIAPNIYYAQGYSGQGVALAGMFGKLMAEAIAGDAGRFDVFTHIRHAPFPGGPLRRPALTIGMLYYRLRDLLA